MMVADYMHKHLDFAYSFTIAAELPKLVKNLDESGQHCIVVTVGDSRTQSSVRFYINC